MVSLITLKRNFILKSFIFATLVLASVSAFAGSNSGTYSGGTATAGAISGSAGGTSSSAYNVSASAGFAKTTGNTSSHVDVAGSYSSPTVTTGHALAGSLGGATSSSEASTTVTGHHGHN